MTGSLRAILALLALALASRVRADNLPYPHGLPLDTVADAVVCAQLRVPSGAVFAAYEQYVRQVEQALVKADADVIRLYQQARVPLGALLSLRDTKRYNEIEQQSEASARALTDALVDAVAAASAPGQDDAVAAIRDSLHIAQEFLQIRGGSSGMIYVHSPGALAESARYCVQGLGDDEQAPLWPALMAFQTANAQGRLRALRSFQDAIRARRLDAAKIVEEQDAVGKPLDQIGPTGMQEVWRCLAGPGMESAQWRDVIREEMQAYAAVEPSLPAHLRAKLARSWFPQLLQSAYADQLQLPMPPDNYEDSPNGFTKAVLRLRSLSPDDRERARAIGRQWIADDVAAQRAVIEACVAGAKATSPQEARLALARRAIRDFAEKAHIATLADNPPQLPENDLDDSISPKDEAEFGKVYKPPPPSDDLARRKAAFEGKPLKYEPAMVDDLCDLLHLSPEQRALLEVAVADARSEWDRDVAPLVEQSYEPPYPRRSQEREGERAAWYTALKLSMDSWVKAIAAADACDAKLFASLKGALSGSVDTGTLDLALAGRRTWEGVKARVDRSVSAPIAVGAVDIPRAVLTATLSQEGRKAAIAAAAPSAALWQRLGRERASLVPQERSARVMGMGGATEMQEMQAAVAAWGEQWDRVEREWAEQEKGAIDRIAGVLAEPDLSVWRATVKRLQWPSCYYTLADLRREALADAARAADPVAAAERVKAILAVADQDALASGNAAVEMMLAIPDPKGTQRRGLASGRSNADRLRLMRSLDYPRYVATVERVIAELPPDSLKSIRRTAASRRLAQGSAK